MESAPGLELELLLLLLLLFTFSRRESGAHALPVSGARARLGGGRRVLLLAGSGGSCPRFRARGWALLFSVT